MDGRIGEHGGAATGYGHGAMRLLRGAALIIMLATAAATGMVDAAARMGLIRMGVAAPLFLAFFAVFLASVGAASANHRALLTNALLAAISVWLGYAAFARVMGQ